MECPYCGKPMEDGRIPGDRQNGMFWLPENEEISVAFANWVMDEKGGIPLADPKFFGFPYLKAYICRECKKGVFEFD